MGKAKRTCIVTRMKAKLLLPAYLIYMCKELTVLTIKEYLYIIQNYISFTLFHLNTSLVLKISLNLTYYTISFFKPTDCMTSSPELLKPPWPLAKQLYVPTSPPTSGVYHLELEQVPCLAKQHPQDVEASGESKIAARALLPHHIIRLSLWKMNMGMLGKRLSFIGRQLWKT